MRKNHHGKKDRLVKRVFALCLALAVICTCLVPVFATEYKEVVDSGEEEIAGFGGDEAAYPDDEVAGFGGDEAAGFGDDFPAVDDGEPREVYDEGEAAGFGEDEVVTRPVEGGEDNLDGGPNVKETEWGTVIEYDTSTSTDTSSSTVTQWSGEDDVVEKPDDKVVVSGDEIKKLQDMVVYRFWLRELNTLDLQDITAQAQINNMTESEYLARNGEVLWNLYFIQAVPRAETIADYSSYIENPSSNRDPKGELRLFDYWYTLDEFGNRVRLNLTDPTSNILDDKTTTVNVYAAWQDGTVGSDEEEKVDHEDLVDKNPVPVDLTAKAAASYVDEKGNEQSVNLPVEVKNLPSAADHLRVIHMGDDDMQTFYESHEDSFGEMMPILGLKISPKNAKGKTVQPANGQKATVTVSGLNALPEMEGATASTLKVLHLKDDGTVDGTVEKLDVLTYTNGTLTFETSSFSPFVVVRTDGYGTGLLDDPVMSLSVEDKTYVINVGQTQKINGVSGYNRNSWSSSDSSIVSIEAIRGSDTSINAVGKKAGTATLTHAFYYWGSRYTEEFTVIVNGTDSAAVYFLFDTEKSANKNDVTEWAGILTYNGNNATVDTTDATWENGSNGNSVLYYKNIKTNVSSYITTWPDGKPGSNPWVLDETARTTRVSNTQNNVTTTKTVEQFVFENYQKKLKELGLPNDIFNALTAKDITITLVPYKISRSNSTDPDKHIDCNVVVTCDKTFTAKFHVLKPGEKNYEEVYSKVYLDGNGNKVQKYTGTDAPAEIVYDGATWKFDGWYPENEVGDGPDEDNGVIPNTEWPYAVKKEQLENHNKDRVVNFYAHYTKVTANLTITKTVTGMLGDQHKAFTFQIVDRNDEPVALTESNIEKSVGNLTEEDKAKVGLVNNGADGKFTLVSGASITLKNLASGEYTVREDRATGYETSWKLGESSDSGTEAKVTVQGTAQTLAFTNHCTLFPDTGVLLDTLPYIVILAVVAGGVALLMLRKRRKEDD